MTSLPERGDVIDGFRVEERLHAGGMGVIYRVSGPDAARSQLVMKAMMQWSNSTSQNCGRPPKASPEK